MKRIFILLLPILAIVSCNLEKDSFRYQNFQAIGNVDATGQIVLPETGATFLITDDKTDGKWKQEQYIFFLCDLDGVNANGSYLTTLKEYKPVHRKAALKKSSTDPAFYGNNAVALYQDWGASIKEHWICVSCLATSLKNSQTAHSINLVYDDMRTNADTLYLELHHQGSGESYENDSYDTSEFQIDTHFLRFDLAEAIPAEAKESIVLHIEWDWFETQNDQLVRNKPQHGEANGILYLTE